LAVQLENAGELVHIGIKDWNLVRDASKECFVGELLRVQVRREHDQHVKWDLKFLSGMEREVIDSGLQWHDPTVQQLIRPYPLTTEVIHEKDSTVRLQLQGCFIELRDGIEGQVQLVEGQLATHDDGRASNSHPAPITGPRGHDAGRLRLTFQ